MSIKGLIGQLPWDLAGPIWTRALDEAGDLDDGLVLRETIKHALASGNMGSLMATLRLVSNAGGEKQVARPLVAAAIGGVSDHCLRHKLTDVQLSSLARMRFLQEQMALDLIAPAGQSKLLEIFACSEKSNVSLFVDIISRARTLHVRERFAFVSYLLQCHNGQHERALLDQLRIVSALKAYFGGDEALGFFDEEQADAMIASRVVPLELSPETDDDDLHRVVYARMAAVPFLGRTARLLYRKYMDAGRV